MHEPSSRPRRQPAHPWIAAERANYGEVTAPDRRSGAVRPAGRAVVDRVGCERLLRACDRSRYRRAFLREASASGASIRRWSGAMPIASYVWWIAIGSGGTLISVDAADHAPALACVDQSLRRDDDDVRGSIAGPVSDPASRQAAIFLLAGAISEHHAAVAAVAQRAGLGFLGDPELSAVLASSSFTSACCLISPPCATVRRRVSAQVLYGAFALGWRGSAHHWRCYETFQITLAALAVPLVVSVHSIVGLDFAASLMPGWQETIFPPYFVVGALFSGFASVAILTALVRWGLRLEAVITLHHFDAMAKILLLASHRDDLFLRDGVVHGLVRGRSRRPFAPRVRVHGRAMRRSTGCSCSSIASCPRCSGFRRVRRNILWVVLISIGINIGMWLERILIIWNTLSHGYAVSLWRLFYPTLWDWTLLFGPLGLFVFFFLCFVRLGAGGADERTCANYAARSTWHDQTIRCRILRC